MAEFDVDGDLVLKLAALLDETGLTEIEFADGERRIRVSKTVQAVAAAPQAAAHFAPGAAGEDASGGDEPASLADHPGAVAVSAATGEGVDVLLRTLSDRLRARSAHYSLSVPYARGDVLAAVHREGEVLSTDDGDAAWRIEARLSDASVGRLEEFVVDAAVDSGLDPAVDSVVDTSDPTTTDLGESWGSKPDPFDGRR